MTLPFAATPILAGGDPPAASAALALAAAFVLAGVAHVVWMGSTWSRRLAIPIDGGLRLRGRRLLGDHKTLRGFVVLPPATAAAMAGVLSLWPDPAALPRPWELDAGHSALLGLLAGLGFMAGELPNSFLKRRCGIEPGQPPVGRASVLFLLLDRVDSLAGMLLAVSLLVPLPWSTVGMLLVIGPVVHLGFSAAQYSLGGKARAA